MQISVHCVPYHGRKARPRYCGKTKIGYVPRSRNAVLAQLAHFGYGGIFEARVQSVDWTCHPERQVRMTIFVRDARA